MARLKALDKSEAPADAVPFYELDEERYGQVLNNTKIYAHSPAVLRAIKTFVGTYNDLRELPVTLKSLVRLRVATLNGCPF